MASLALGILACVICWMPVLGLAAVPIGLIGALLGLLGFVLSTLFRKSSAALPAGGFFICLLAGAISIASTGSLLHYRQRLEKLIPRSIVPPSIIPPPPSGSAPSAVSPAAQPSDPKVFTATQQLSAANEAATQRFKQTDAYRQAKELRDQAHDQVDALSISSPNSDALKQAAQKLIDADNALSAKFESFLRTDPTVLAAQQKTHCPPPSHHRPIVRAGAGSMSAAPDDPSHINFAPRIHTPLSPLQSPHAPNQHASEFRGGQCHARRCRRRGRLRYR